MSKDEQHKNEVRYLENIIKKQSVTIQDFADKLEDEIKLKNLADAQCDLANEEAKLYKDLYEKEKKSKRELEGVRVGMMERMAKILQSKNILQ